MNRGSRIALITAVCVVAGILSWFGFQKGACGIHSSSVMNIKAIHINGTQHVDRDEVLKRIRETAGGNLFAIDKNKVISSICANPWIEAVKIGKSLNGTLRITITERKPAAVVNLGRIFFADRKGVLIPVQPGTVSNLPLASGVEDTTDENGKHMLKTASRERVNRFMNALAKSELYRTMTVSQVVFENDGVLRMIIDGSVTVVDIDEKNIDDRLTRLVVLGRSMRQAADAPSRIDLRYQNLAFITKDGAASSGKAGAVVD